MNQAQSKTAIYLTYAGALPLIISAILLWFVNDISSSFVLFATTAYSAIIISFLSGIHWACYLFYADKSPYNLLIISNIIALLAWVSFLIPYPPIQILIHMFCFLSLLCLDRTLLAVNIIPSWFYTLRRNATIIVVISLVLIMIETLLPLIASYTIAD
jgi:hypothetical protein